MKKNNSISSLYIHIPFCQSICDYCDFPKLQYFRIFAEKYLQALKKEINETVENKKIKTIYVGGGTPTSLEDDLFEQLFKIIEPYSKYVDEYTFEANPESLSPKKIELMKRYGVNRVSIGVESTDSKILKSINRRHTLEDVIKAVSSLKEYGINNYNVDLILGLPNVTKTLLKKDLINILALKPKHISTYSLTVHPHTRFYLNKISEPDDDLSYELYSLVHQTLEENGYIHYEVSNFALPGYESKHNFVYWKNEQYYGVGFGAAGFIGNIRYKNTSNFDSYLKGNNIREEEIVDLKDDLEYQIMLNLRTNQGIDLAYFNNKFNKDLYREKKIIIDDYMSQGYLFIDKNHLIATFKGMMILDKIIIDLI